MFETLSRKLPRLYGWILFSLLLLLLAWWLAPHRIPLTGWKVVLVTGGAVLGYWLDRALFPYARPGDMVDAASHPATNSIKWRKHSLLWNANLAGLRRAIIVFACIIGLTMGL
jgi:hypothetical protein